MVGDTWEWDVVQPARVGIATYWIADVASERPDDQAAPVGQGGLGQFFSWIQQRLGGA
jgi:hypothetical protein